MLDFGESDKMIKVSGKVDKSNTYNGFIGYISFFETDSFLDIIRVNGLYIIRFETLAEIEKNPKHLNTENETWALFSLKKTEKQKWVTKFFCSYKSPLCIKDINAFCKTFFNDTEILLKELLMQKQKYIQNYTSCNETNIHGWSESISCSKKSDFWLLLQLWIELQEENNNFQVEVMLFLTSHTY